MFCNYACILLLLENMHKFFFIIVPSQDNIRKTPFHQKSQQNPEVGGQQLHEYIFFFPEKEKKKPTFILNCVITGQYYDYALKSVVSMTPKSKSFAVFLFCRFKKFKEKRRRKITFFENCVITGPYQEYILQPEVSTTLGSGCFAMAQTDKHTYIMDSRQT